jgi:hypothetical protein
VASKPQRGRGAPPQSFGSGGQAGGQPRRNRTFNPQIKSRSKPSKWFDFLRVLLLSCAERGTARHIAATPTQPGKRIKLAECGRDFRAHRFAGSSGHICPWLSQSNLALASPAGKPPDALHHRPVENLRSTLWCDRRWPVDDDVGWVAAALAGVLACLIARATRTSATVGHAITRSMVCSLVSSVPHSSLARGRKGGPDGDLGRESLITPARDSSRRR